MTDSKDKMVCVECIGDAFVKDMIVAEKTEADCDYCRGIAPSVSIEQLANWVDPVYREHYGLGEEYAVFPHGQEKPNWEMAGSYPEEILGDILEADSDVVDDLLEELSDQEAYVVHHDGETQFYDSAYCYESTPVYDFHHSDLWNLFCSIVKHQSRYFNTGALNILNELFEGVTDLKYFGDQAPVRTIDLESEERFMFRARSARNKSSRIKICLNPNQELGAPPAYLAPTGRMNPAGISVFYGALDRGTCLSELRLPVGDVAVSGKFELIKPLTVMDLSMFHGVYKELSLFDPEFEGKAGHLKFLRRFENEISRPIYPGDELLEYVPTQALVEYLANYHEPKIDALIYSSTQTNGAGKNIAIFGHAVNAVSADPDYLEKVATKRFEETWMPEHSIYSVSESDNDEHGEVVEYLKIEDSEIDPTIQYVGDSIEVHQIKAIEHNYDSESVSIWFAEDLKNLDF